MEVINVNILCVFPANLFFFSYCSIAEVKLYTQFYYLPCSLNISIFTCCYKVLIFKGGIIWALLGSHSLLAPHPADCKDRLGAGESAF